MRDAQGFSREGIDQKPLFSIFYGCISPWYNSEFQVCQRYEYLYSTIFISQFINALIV